MSLHSSRSPRLMEKTTRKRNRNKQERYTQPAVSGSFPESGKEKTEAANIRNNKQSFEQITTDGDIRMNTLIQKISMTVLCASAALGAWAAVATVPSVRVEKVSEVKKTESKVYVGTVYASETVDIVARIDGVMWKSAFREGSLVKKE